METVIEIANGQTAAINPWNSNTYMPTFCVDVATGRCYRILSPLLPHLEECGKALEWKKSYTGNTFFLETEMGLIS